MSDRDRCDVEYAIQWPDGDIEPFPSGPAADRFLAMSCGRGVIVRRHIRTVYGEWERPR